MRISILTPTIRPDGLKRVRDSLLKQTEKDFEWLVEINSTGEVDLNAVINKMLKRAQGELIVFLQDYISIEPDGLEKFWKAYKKNPKVFYTAPVGKIRTPLQREPQFDWRKHRDYAGWQEWEIDWGSAPKKALFEIGGFDEALDEYWGFDNCVVALKAKLADYTFACLQDNVAIAIDHDATMDHPFRHLRNPDFYNSRLDQIKKGLNLNYLE